MSKFGIKISRPGVDVTTASDADLVYSSEFNTFKIYRIMYFDAIDAQKHGLDYPPAFDYISEYNADQWVSGNGSYYNAFQGSVYVDDTYVYSQTTNPTYVILFIDPLDE